MNQYNCTYCGSMCLELEKGRIRKDIVIICKKCIDSKLNPGPAPSEDTGKDEDFDDYLLNFLGLKKK